MARSKPSRSISELAAAALPTLHEPVGIILGSPREAADVVAIHGGADVVCYQMDLYQADRLREELTQRGLSARVVTLPDLWDLPERFQSLVYPVPQGGERNLKLDMIEQAFHILVPHGHLAVLSPYEKDQFFPLALKKIYGKVRMPAAGQGMVFFCHREGERPRRRHEVIFQVSQGDQPSLRFLSRPGTFSYGRFDNGARALVETMDIHEGDRVLDIGCGCGTNGIHAAVRSGPSGCVAFVDSNVRAVALAEHNARAASLQHFQAVASSTVHGIEPQSFHVVLANPPYYAQHGIARLFIERGFELIRPGGRFYLVTKQPDQVGPIVTETFAGAEVVERRGYFVLCAQRTT
jgi:16S rRNA (guanine1207-N2)-methyltransferase